MYSIYKYYHYQLNYNLLIMNVLKDNKYVNRKILKYEEKCMKEIKINKKKKQNMTADFYSNFVHMICVIFVDGRPRIWDWLDGFDGCWFVIICIHCYWPIDSIHMFYD